MGVVHKLLALSVASSPVLANVPTLRDAASKHGLLIGAATNVGCLRNTSEPMYMSIAHSQFSITTAENSCKVGPIHPYPTMYDFSGCDAIFDSAASAEQRVRGHNLCWHQQNPAWLNSTLSPDELVNALDSHILTVVGRYGDRAYAWDVVNEAVSDGGASQPMLKTECAPFCVRYVCAPGALSVHLRSFQPWLPKVPDFVDRAFRAARNASKTAKLFYNDYGAEAVNAKSDRVLALVKAMRARGVPIDGVGFQM